MSADSRAFWSISPRAPEAERRLSATLNVHPTLAAVLVARGMTEPDQVREYLAPTLDNLHDPFGLPDAEEAAERIIRAIGSDEAILVHGDYDADGVTSAALLVRFLQKLGADVHYFIPHRFKDSYGLSARAVRMSAGKVGLIIAVDCGVRDHEVIAAAAAQGQDVIVVDHHEPSDTLPEPALVVNPKREDSTYPERELAAVGLAFKLASAICLKMDLPEKSLQRAFLDLVAIGTIADVAPLAGENRTMVASGLRLLPHTRKIGLQVLLELCELEEPIGARDVAFRVGPRLNAVGRMADAADALELLLTDDEVDARRKALELEGLNRRRRKEQDRIFREAQQMLEAEDCPAMDRVVVLGREGWHRGVIGIVASKVLEATGLPTVMLAVEGEQARGSARSIEQFDMADALRQCDDVLLRHGGHRLAAGLELETARIGDLRQRLNEVGRTVMPERVPAGRLAVDCEVGLDEVDEELVAALALMEPCGEGNRSPVLCARGVTALDVRTVGADDRHLKLMVGDGDRRVECIGFGLGMYKSELSVGANVDLCFVPNMNDYMGRSRLQLQLEDVRPAQ